MSESNLNDTGLWLTTQGSLCTFIVQIDATQPSVLYKLFHSVIDLICVDGYGLALVGG